MNYGIFRSQPIMTINDLAQIGSHNKREKKAYKSNKDIKLELTKNNIELVPLTEKYVKGFKLKVKEFKKTTRYLENKVITINKGLDNAFVKISDKSKISFYIELIKDNDKFPLVMTMLAKWNIDEAKKIIIDRLENDKIKTLSIRVLGVL